MLSIYEVLEGIMMQFKQQTSVKVWSKTYLDSSDIDTNLAVKGYKSISLMVKPLQSTIRQTVYGDNTEQQWCA